jgi:hypothetical protein
MTSDVFTQSTPQAPLIHQKSRFVFPIQVGSFRRERPTQYDQAGEDISVGYNNYSIPIAVTVYVYPAHARSLTAEFTSRQAEILHAHPGAQLVVTSNVTITPAKITALSASYTFEDRFAGAIQPLRSELLVAQSGERFVEYRVTYPVSMLTSAQNEIAEFEREFAWP